MERRIALTRLGKTERGPCERITYRKTLWKKFQFGQKSVCPTVALSAAADKAKGQNRNYPGARENPRGSLGSRDPQ
jgi:hypothetical protein